MSRRARRHGSGGRTGQHYSATPSLRSYSTPPAGPVTVTRADGTVEVHNPQKAVRDVPKPRRKAPAQNKPLPLPTMKQLLTVECPSCGRAPGEPCTLRQGHRARVELYRASTGQRSTPAGVKEAVQKGAEAREEKLAARRTVSAQERAKRAEQSEAAKAANRRKGSKGNPYKSPNARAVGPEWWSKVTCPRCKSGPEALCTQKTVKDEVVESSIPHPERLQVVRRVWARQSGS